METLGCENTMRQLDAEMMKTYHGSVNNAALALSQEHNLLSQVLAGVEDVFRKAGTHCMVCDGPLEFPSIKPSVCEKDVCKFAYAKCNLGFSLEREVIQNP